MKKGLLLLFFMCGAFIASSQVPTDGLLMPSKSLCTGFMFQQDQWHEYWEGTRKRDNLNIGELTTQSVMWYGVYGLGSRTNIMAMLPFVSTNASKGTMRGLSGLQDLSLAVKYKLVSQKAGAGNFSTFVGGAVSTPMSDYTPDFLPFSIGLHSTNLSGRLNVNYSMDMGLYVNASAAYTWRSNVFIDRPAYFTDGQYISSKEVPMPAMTDFKFDIGYHKGPIQTELTYIQMNTLGGGDIRRQDMPFVSNRMNASRVGALVMYYLPWPRNFGVRGSVNYTVAGRNVGQTVSVMGGILYTIYFKKKETIN